MCLCVCVMKVYVCECVRVYESMCMHVYVSVCIEGGERVSVFSVCHCVRAVLYE